MAFKRLLLSLIPGKIWQQIGLVFAFILTIALILLGYLLIDASRQAVTGSVLRDYETLTSRTARHLSEYVEKPQSILVNTAEIMESVGISDTDTQRVLLYRMVTDYPAWFERVAIADAAGIETVSSDLDNVPVHRLFVPPKREQPRILGSKSGAEAPSNCRSITHGFELALTANTYSTGAVYRDIMAGAKTAVSKVYFSPEHFPYITLAVQLKRLDNLSGILVAEIKLSGIWEIIDEIKLGGGQAFLVDDQGYTLVHNEEKRVYQGENLKNSKAIQSVLQGSNGSLEESSDKGAGNKWLSAYAPVSPFGWGLIIRQPVNEAYAFSIAMRQDAVIIIAGAIICAALLSLVIANWIVRPIKKLIAVTGSVAAGDLDQSIESPRHDEVGQLLNSFDRMIQKLKKARQAEKLSNIGIATSKIAHELRHPLVALKTFIQLLPRRYQDEKFIDQFQQTVPPELARLEKMLGSMTSFSAEHKLNLTNHGIQPLVQNCLDLFKENISQQNVAVNIHCRPDNLAAMIDVDSIKQVAINLIQNALDAMPKGGNLNIDIKMRPSEQPDRPEMVEISFADTGCGMNQTQLANVFEPFHTSKFSGLGLGLAICKEIIEQHQGIIEVASKENQGTTFVVKLPIGL
ncbi:MAG: ATP-binding protein [Planctomycetota bacterium]